MKKVKDVMSNNCRWIAPDATIAEAAAQMKREDIGFLSVGENDRLTGSLTDRDIAIRCVAEGKDPKACKVRECMTKKVLYVFDDQDAEEVCDNMAEMKVRRFPVVNRQKRLVGVVSFGDLSQACEAETVASTQAQITQHNRRSKAA